MLFRKALKAGNADSAEPYGYFMAEYQANGAFKASWEKASSLDKKLPFGSDKVKSRMKMDDIYSKRENLTWVSITEAEFNQLRAVWIATRQQKGYTVLPKEV